MILVNCARGGIINEDALLRALNSGKVRAISTRGKQFIGTLSGRKSSLDRVMINNFEDTSRPVLQITPFFKETVSVATVHFTVQALQ